MDNDTDDKANTQSHKHTHGCNATTDPDQHVLITGDEVLTCEICRKVPPLEDPPDSDEVPERYVAWHAMCGINQQEPNSRAKEASMSSTNASVNRDAGIFKGAHSRHGQGASKKNEVVQKCPSYESDLNKSEQAEYLKRMNWMSVGLNPPKESRKKLSKYYDS